MEKNCVFLPKDIKIEKSFRETFSNSLEAQTVARNIVIVSQKINPDLWTSFSFSEYKERLDNHPPSVFLEERVLEALFLGGTATKTSSICLEPGFLKKFEGKYEVTQKFLNEISKFSSL